MNSTLDAALQRYLERVEALRDQKATGTVTREETIRSALVGLPATYAELEPLLKSTLSVGVAAVREEGHPGGALLDVFTLGILLGYCLGREEG